MKNLITKICILSVTGLSIANAHNRCVDDNWIFLNKKIQSVGECKAGLPLSLEKIYANYPMMSQGPYLVEYWQGSFQRELTYQKTFLHEVLDLCSYPDRVILSENATRSEKKLLNFVVDNPNLHDTVTASYDLVPMTQAEATLALSKAQQKCLEYKP